MNCHTTPFPGGRIFHTRCDVTDESALRASDLDAKKKKQSQNLIPKP